MNELAIFLLKALVDKPEEVELSHSEDNGTLRLKARISAGDKGKIIGKNGKVIKALRAIVSAGASKQGKKVFLDIE
ncbi:MAG: KH domain-containing protein [Elusimicrobia bacterium]|nr:KH domain-containing protein [Elusimicrobiota bacterium]